MSTQQYSPRRNAPPYLLQSFAPLRLRTVGESCLGLWVFIFIFGATCAWSQPFVAPPAHDALQPTPRANIPPLAEVSIGSNPGRAIPPTFMGIAHEWGDAQTIMGSSETGVNPIYRTLLNNLTAYGSGPIIVRIGGNSTDTSKEPTPSTIRPFAELAASTGAHFYLGVNLGAGKQQLAIDQARFFVAQMPPDSIDAIEIGNEPDSFSDKGMRSPSYSFEVYLKEFDAWRLQVYPLLRSGAGLLGPSWAYPASLVHIRPFLDAEHQYLFAVSQHFYVADACRGKINSPETLLFARNTSGGATRLRDAVAAVHQSHIPFRIDEINSVACGGQDGLSNTFGSALWAIDIMFEFASIGVDGVNWQSPNHSHYGALDFNINPGHLRTYTLNSARPLYYGMLFFQAATGKQSHLLPVTISERANIKAWATIDNHGIIRLSLINKETSESGTVLVSLPGFTRASISRLNAAKITSKTGLTFAGQTLDGSPDGHFQGQKLTETAQAPAGSFQFSISPGSAVLAEFER